MALKAACSLFVLASAIPSVLALPAADKNADVCRTGIYAVFSTYQDGSGPTREQCAKYNVQCSPHQRMKRQLSTTPAAPSTTPRAPATTRAISTTPAAPSTAEVTTPSTTPSTTESTTAATTTASTSSAVTTTAATSTTSPTTTTSSVMYTTESFNPSSYSWSSIYTDDESFLSTLCSCIECETIATTSTFTRPTTTSASTTSFLGPQPTNRCSREQANACGGCECFASKHRPGQAIAANNFKCPETGEPGCKSDNDCPSDAPYCAHDPDNICGSSAGGICLGNKGCPAPFFLKKRLPQTPNTYEPFGTAVDGCC